jgi:hypothetical protein
MKGILFAVTTGLLVARAAVNAGEVDPGVSTQSQTVTVDCECDTKKTPSWCGTKIGDAETLIFSRDAKSNSKIEWTDEFAAEYCARNADLACLCKGKEYFRGKVRQN